MDSTGLVLFLLKIPYSANNNNLASMLDQHVGFPDMDECRRMGIKVIRTSGFVLSNVQPLTVKESVAIS